jgi:hypothetical protein
MKMQKPPGIRPRRLVNQHSNGIGSPPAVATFVSALVRERRVGTEDSDFVPILGRCERWKEIGGEQDADAEHGWRAGR